MLACYFKRKNRLSGLVKALALSQMSSTTARGQDPACCALSTAKSILRDIKKQHIEAEGKEAYGVEIKLPETLVK